MNYSLTTQTKYGKFRSFVYRTLGRPYLATALFAYVFVGLAVTLYLMKQPTFKSEMELVLPGTGATASVAIDDVGY